MHVTLAIAVGGAAGPVARHLVNDRITVWFGWAFPWGILVANVLGLFIMGALVESTALAVGGPAAGLAPVRSIAG